jgi:cell division cycle protein 37
MTSLTNYSKWDHIQLSSDDDEDCHPNIEKFTWRRLRAQQRAQKREEEDHEEDQINAEIAALENKIAELKKFAATAQTLSAISIHQTKIDQHRKYLATKAAVRKLTPDEMCAVTFDATKVNKNAELEHVTPPALQKTLAADKEVDPHEFSAWHKKHDGILREYIGCETLEKSAAFVQQHPELLSTNATGWLLLAALDKQMEGDSDAMRHHVRQNQFLQYPMDLAKLSGQTNIAAAKSFFGA